MKKALPLVLALILLGLPNESRSQQNELFIVDTFEDDEIGSLPKGWYNMKGDRKLSEYEPRDRKQYKYEVREDSDGNRYLHYEGSRAKHLNYPLVNKKGINIHETPILTWRWRVHDLPEGADETSSDHNDAAASIYVVFDMANYVVKKLPVSIRYTWSSTLPVGTNGSKLMSKQQIEVVASGKDRMGEWVTFQRNLLEDYRRLHGGTPPKKPVAILILSDGNSVGDTASADYDDIMFKAK